jgi:hypothetical protein
MVWFDFHQAAKTEELSIVIASGAKQSMSYNGREWIASSLRSSQ